MKQSIKIENLSVSYGSREILHALNLNIGCGMYGLLGRNGAGKTTLMKAIVGLIPHQEGSINICGIDSKAMNPHRNLIGYLPQDFDFYKNFKVKEALTYLGILSGLSKAHLKTKVQEVLQRVNLHPHQRKRIRELSGGMKRRLGIAQALLHDPQVLIIDEPTAGLDPEERIRFRHMMSDLAKDKVILLSTHIAEDIEKTCKETAILHQGSLLYTGSIQGLIDQTKGLTYETLLPYERLEAFENQNLVYHKQALDSQIQVKFLYKGQPKSDYIPILPTIEAAYLNLLYDEGGTL
jgi:ABC-2 type transport system ATP-binding protein